MRTALVLTVVAGLIVLMGPSAQATTRDITDPPDDVMLSTSHAHSDETYSRVGGAENDIVFARIQHTATQVVVYLRHRQLTVPQQYGGFDFLIQGSSRQTILEAGILTRHGDPQGYSYAYTEKNCAHTSHINYAGDSAWIRIARSCLKNPKYIRVDATSYRERIPPEGSGSPRLWYDNPARDGGPLNEEAWTPWVVTG